MSKTAEKVGHTPGPWQWQSFDGGKTVFLGTPDRGRLVVMDFERVGMNRAGPRFAMQRNGEDRGGVLVSGTKFRIDEHPDARLIETAPVLLSACQAALAHVTELEDAWQRGALRETDGSDRSNRNVEVRVALSAAIAKAEGQ